jgi:hypothetical protein
MKNINSTIGNKYIITSGWWCGDDPNEIRKRQGSEEQRELAFFQEWKQSILQHTSPQKILVLDSASPTKPTPDMLEGIEFISLLTNPGHSTNHIGRYSGYMRSIIMGVTYASLCDADYWVYVEQDVLLKGEGIIEHCIETMQSPYMFGSGAGTPQFLQQSLIIIRRDGFDDFLKRMNNIKSTDSEIAPESKFLIASSSLFSLIPECFFRYIRHKNFISKVFKKILKILVPIFKGYDELPIGYGRTRPIDFNDHYYYFQHGSVEELSKHRTQCIKKRVTHLS